MGYVCSPVLPNFRIRLRKKREFVIPTAEKNISFCNNFLSLCDNASCKLAYIDAAEFGNSAELREEKPPANNKHSEGVPHLLQYDALLLAKRFCFASILKNKSGKPKELILRFSALLI